MNVSDFLEKDLFDSVSEQVYELESLLNFVFKNGVSLSNEQIKAIFLLREFDCGDIANFVFNARSFCSSNRDFLSIIDSVTMGDRIKGTAKLVDILKSSVSAPSSRGNNNGFSYPDLKFP